MTRLEIANLSKRFAAVRAVDDISLVVEPGELFFLLGPSGCGKTTLLRMLAGFVRPDAGRIQLDERDVTDLPAHARNCGMVFQNYALWPHMTVAENIAFGLRVRKWASADRRARVEEMLAIVRLDGLADRRPGQLSGGQQQRVALARALAIRPALLLLDEPLSNLDAKLRSEMRAEIIRICRATGVTTVYVTHDQKEALSMADRLAVVRDGRIVQLGRPADVYRRPASRFVADFLGRTNLVRARVASVNDKRVELEAAGIGRLVAESEEISNCKLQIANCKLPDNDPSRLAATRSPGGAEGSASGWAAVLVGDQVECSLRPETIRLLPTGQTGGPDNVPQTGPVNVFPADLVETVYLGEIAQHTLRLADGSTLEAYELHPRFIGSAGQPIRVHCQVDPADVTILPGEDVDSGTR